MTLPAVETAPSRVLPDKGPGQKPGHATLLALDGRCIETLALPTVVQLFHCTPPRLDILVTNSPKAATTLLGGLLMDLERHGIDYRLTSTEGSLTQEMLHYVRRVPCISVILVDCLETCEDESILDALRREGYRITCVLNHGLSGGSCTVVLDGVQGGRT